jgi:DNA polymerase-1
MLRQILEALDRFAPDALVFGLDDRGSSVREERYAAYKAGRAPKDPQLVEQLERCKPFRDVLGLHAVQPDGLEADDVSASAAAWAGQHGWDCVIVTSDRDTFAHISDHTKVLRLIDGGIHGSPLLDPARLRTMYGVAAEHYLDFAALRGDASDNLPGVRGIGEKSAALLLSAVGPMEAVWADIDNDDGSSVVAALDAWAEETGGRRTSRSLVRHLTAEGAREQFEFNRALMAGHTDVDLGLTPDEPGTPGLLPLEHARVLTGVGHLGVQATTDLAVRVLTEPPGSAAARSH